MTKPHKYYFCNTTFVDFDIFQSNNSIIYPAYYDKTP